MNPMRALLAMALLLGLLSRVQAVEREPRGAGEVGVDLFTTHGESEWEVIFLDDEFGFGRSNLKWRDLDGELYGLHGVANLGRWFSVAAAYAEGDLEGGPVTDSDVLSDAFLGVDNYLFSESKSDIAGDVQLYHIDLRLQLEAMEGLAQWPARLYLLAGYQRYDEDIRMRQGVQTVVNEEPVQEPIEGLNSTFDFEWKAYRIGLGGAFGLADTLTLRLQAVALVGVDFEGAGYWNLRDDFRSEAPSFEHEGNGGSGTDLRIVLAWRPLPALLLETGLWQISMDIKDGQERLYLADGSTEELPVSSVETRRTGGFITASLCF